MSDKTVSRTPASIAIRPRDISHDFNDSIPRYWAGGNPVLTAFFNALSTIIPEGERFFIQSVNAVMSDVDDPVLKKEVKGFIAQEGSHRSEHKSLNQWIRQQGYPIEKYEGCIQRLLGFVGRRFSARQQLAGTLALEHMSSLLTDQFLRSDAIREKLDPAMQRFFIWHSIEENEHKAVPYDVYQQVFGGYWTRVLQLLVITLMFAPNVAFIQCRYLWHDGEFFNVKAWFSATAFFLFKPGWFMRTLPGYLCYFKPGFHPWQLDNSSLINHWVARLDADTEH